MTSHDTSQDPRDEQPFQATGKQEAPAGPAAATGQDPVLDEAGDRIADRLAWWLFRAAGDRQGPLSLDYGWHFSALDNDEMLKLGYAPGDLVLRREDGQLFEADITVAVRAAGRVPAAPARRPVPSAGYAGPPQPPVMDLSFLDSEIGGADGDCYEPLTRDEVAALLAEAARTARYHSQRTARIQIRLVRGIKGITLPYPDEGPDSERKAALDHLFVDQYWKGADPGLVDEMCRLMDSAPGASPSEPAPSQSGHAPGENGVGPQRF